MTQYLRSALTSQQKLHSLVELKIENANSWVYSFSSVFIKNVNLRLKKYVHHVIYCAY